MGHQSKVREMLGLRDKPVYTCDVCGRRCASLAEIQHSPAMCTECWEEFWNKNWEVTDSDKFEQFIDEELGRIRKEAI